MSSVTSLRQRHSDHDLGLELGSDPIRRRHSDVGSSLSQQKVKSDLIKDAAKSQISRSAQNLTESLQDRRGRRFAIVPSADGIEAFRERLASDLQPEHKKTEHKVMRNVRGVFGMPTSPSLELLDIRKLIKSDIESAPEKVKQLIETKRGAQQLEKFAIKRMTLESYNFLQAVNMYQKQLNEYRKKVERPGFSSKEESECVFGILEVYVDILEKFIIGNQCDREEHEKLTLVNVSDRIKKALTSFKNPDEIRLGPDHQTNKTKFESLITRFDPAVEEVLKTDWVNDFFKSEEFAALKKMCGI